MSFGSDFVLTLFTNNPQLAYDADRAGINRIGLDLERLGKANRQAGLSCWISDHHITELAKIRAVLRTAQLFVRTNPMHAGLEAEIEAYLEGGAQVLMLPMVSSADEVARFIDLVAGRALVSLLVETPAGAMRMHDIVKVAGIDEIHIGLNDLRLGMGLQSHFEVVVSDFLDVLAAIVHDAGIPFGFGGVGRLNDPRLPIPADLIYAQYARLHATRALVSRVFVTADTELLNLSYEVAQLRWRLDYWHNCHQESLDFMREELRALVAARSAVATCLCR